MNKTINHAAPLMIIVNQETGATTATMRIHCSQQCMTENGCIDNYKACVLAMNAWWMHRDDFTDRIRMEVIPELIARICLAKRYIDMGLRMPGTPNYRNRFKDGKRYVLDTLNAVLDDMDAAEKALAEEVIDE